MSIEGKVAVVTGAARGLGRAICERLAEDGVLIAAWDLNLEGAQETTALIREHGGRAIACGGDASSSADIAAALEQTRSELGRVSILVNNAALSPFCKFEELTEEAFDKLIAINLKGPFLCCKAMVPDMVEDGWGRVINISSSSAQTGAKSMAHYVASKGGVIGLTKALAQEYATAGITFNNVPPNFVDTPGLRNAPVDVDAFAESTPMKRTGKPRNIAAAVAFLASDDADYITGHTLGVNGGRYSN
jgi:2-hydroxycyclohexanecarboxyl-CoA dehydrogenase